MHVALRLAATAAAFVFATIAHAQSVTGTFATNIPDNSPFTFECTGNNPCVGTYRGLIKPRNCTNYASLGGSFSLSGNLFPSPSGPVNSVMTLAKAEITPVPKPDGSCTFPPGNTLLQTFSGNWNGTQGTLTGKDNDNTGTPITTVLSYQTQKPAALKMTVNADVNGPVSNATASVQFDPALVGTTQNLYVFAVAPAAIVKRLTDAKADTALPCVIAQLNSAGQLVSVSAASLQAYVSGVISAGAQAVTILNNVPTVNIAGATFMLGVGPTPTAAIGATSARAAVTVPGATACKAEKPQTGWWWNEQEGGRGFSIEARDGSLFFAGYLYDATGQATWLAAAGPTALEGSVFQGELLAFANGQTMSGPYRAPAAQPSPGPVTLTFSDSSHGVLSWPGGNIPIKRFEFLPNSLIADPAPTQPESGWWWNDTQSGRGYFIEWQGTNAFLATYLYTSSGSPTWNASFAATPDVRRFAGSLTSYAGGQTLTGPYRAPTSTTSVGNIGVTFSGPDNGVLTWPDGTQVPIKRFRF